MKHTKQKFDSEKIDMDFNTFVDCEFDDCDGRYGTISDDLRQALATLCHRCAHPRAH